MICARRRVILVRSAADSCKPEACGFPWGRADATLYNIRSGYLSQVACGCVIAGAGQRPGSAWQEDFSPGSHSEHFQKAYGSWGKAHPMCHIFISTDYQMSKRRFTSIIRGIHDFGELGSHMGHGKTAVEAVGHEIASDLAFVFPFPIWGSLLRPSKQQSPW